MISFLIRASSNPSEWMLNVDIHTISELFYSFVASGYFAVWIFGTTLYNNEPHGILLVWYLVSPKSKKVFIYDDN